MRDLLLSLEQRLPSFAEPGTVIGSLAGGVLLAVLGWAIFHVPVLLQVGLLAAVAMVLGFFTQTRYSLIAFFAIRALLDLMWWIPGSILSMNLMELFTGGVTGMALVLFVLEFRRLDRHPCVPPFIPYALVLMVGAIRNLEVRSAAEIMARYASPFIMMFLVSMFFDTRERRRQLFVVATAVGVVPVLLSLYHLGTGQMSTYVLAGYKRLLGGYKNLHNHALMMMLIGTMAGWRLMQTRSRLHRLAFAAYAGAALLCLYMTYVRTALLGVAAFGAVYLTVNRQRRLLALGAVGLALFIMISPAMQDRFKDLVLFFVSADEGMLSRRKLGSGRWGLWTTSFGEYLTYPLRDIILGLGLGKHWLLTREAFNPYNPAQQGYVDPHSDYLTMTYQVGPIATLSYLAMQVQVIRYGLKVHKISPDAWSHHFASFMVAVTFATFAANTVSNAFINRTTLAWFYWGLAGLLFAEWESISSPLRRARTPAAPASVEPAAP